MSIKYLARLGLAVASLAWTSPTLARITEMTWAGTHDRSFGDYGAGTPFTLALAYDDQLPALFNGGTTYAAWQGSVSSTVTAGSDAFRFDRLQIAADKFPFSPTAVLNLFGSSSTDPSRQWRMTLANDTLGVINFQGVPSANRLSSLTPTSFLLSDAQGIAIVSDRLSYPKPSLEELARLSDAVYAKAQPKIDTRVTSTAYSLSATAQQGLGFYGAEYRNGNQIVIAFRGTTAGENKSFKTIKDLLADQSFVTGVATEQLESYVSKAAVLVRDARAKCSWCTITLTGHSLGGAIAEIVGHESGYETKVFNAPGAGKLLEDLADEASVAVPRAGRGLGSRTNYRLSGDGVSQVGEQVGAVVTIGESTVTGFDAFKAALSHRHSISTVITNLRNGAQQEVGMLGPRAGLDEFGKVIKFALCGALSNCVFQPFFQDGGPNLFDPDEASRYEFIVAEGSPFLKSMMLPHLDGVDFFRLGVLADGVWSEAGVVRADELYTFAQLTRGFWFSAYSSDGNLAVLPEGLIFEVSFDRPGLVEASLKFDPIAQVPEPATWAMMIAGFGLVGASVRRSKLAPA